jgi:DNA polymerase I
LKALLDGDIVSYSCAIYNEEWGWDACKEDIDQLMRRILETTGATEYECYISGANNFRYRINPDYKANRKDKVDPIYRSDANAYLVSAFGAKVTDGYEADDGLGISATRSFVENSPFVICSIDKDLKMLPGDHYNWRKNIFDHVTPIDGLRSFYRQLLTGDRTDGIRGVGGIGDVKSARIINDLESEAEMYAAVQAMYDTPERLLMNAQCLWIMRYENEMWRPPVETERSEEDPRALQE